MSPFPDQGAKLKTVVVITFALYSEKTDVSDGVRVARSLQLPTGTAKVAQIPGRLAASGPAPPHW